MKQEGSPRQIRTLAFVALLSPISSLPGVAAGMGGSLGWLSPLLAAPLAAGGLLLFRKLGPEGLGDTLRTCWGRLGLGVGGLYYLWLMALAALTLGLGTHRLAGTDYGGASRWLLSLVLLGAGWYLTLHGRVPFLRAGEMFCLVFLGTLALAGVLGVMKMDPAALIPDQGATLSGVLKGLFPAAGTMAVGSGAALFPRTAPKEKEGRWAPAVWCLAAAGVCLLVIGTLGAPLAAELPLPFFLTLQGMAVSGGLQRLEALGTAVWALSDLALLGMTALAGEKLTGDRPWGRYPILAAGFLGGAFLSPDRIAPLRWVMWGAGLALGLVLPALLLLTKKRREKKEGPGTSCGGFFRGTTGCR